MGNNTQLLLHLARLMGWEVVGPEIARVDHAPNKVYVDRDGRYWRMTDDRERWVEWRPLHSMDDALLIMRHFEAAGCSAWIECDGQTGRRGGVTTGAGRFEAEADTEARALCYAALMSKGIEAPALAAAREDTNGA